MQKIKSLQELQNFLKIREEKYLLIRHATCIRLEKAYSRLISLRKFAGRVVIDHDQETVDIIVRIFIYFPYSSNAFRD